MITTLMRRKTDDGKARKARGAKTAPTKEPKSPKHPNDSYIRQQPWVVYDKVTPHRSSLAFQRNRHRWYKEDPRTCYLCRSLVRGTDRLSDRSLGEDSPRTLRDNKPHPQDTLYEDTDHLHKRLFWGRRLGVVHKLRSSNYTYP